ncbi:MAG: hypothetical protein RIS94_3598 [Pseudomonadota bacterium]
MAYANLKDLQLWAEREMLRAPDFVIGDNYLRRWWMIPRNELSNVYLHEFRKSDDDRALHDHPWDSTSVILFGRYREHLPGGISLVRRAGDVVTRTAEQLHRVELEPGETCITLFITGPKVREWGFQCPQGWVHWQDFTDPTDSSQTGRGCGEHDARPPRVAQPNYAALGLGSADEAEGRN